MKNETNLNTITAHLQATLARIADAVTKADRGHDTVQLIAVSKAQPAIALREAFEAGQVAFGENYLQEALNKQHELSDLAIEWHFIGPIQSNKTQAIAQHFAWVHGVDRLKIAQRLNDARGGKPPLQICIQVNVSNEDSKSGVLPNEVYALAESIGMLPHLNLRGLMAIPEPTNNVELQHQQFKIVYALLKQLNQQGFVLDTLSMGMSSDYVVAIAEGATMVRIGSAIFGARPTKLS
jgi:pyridoxal phosphate enzyme (YggS family)